MKIVILECHPIQSIIVVYFETFKTCCNWHGVGSMEMNAIGIRDNDIGDEKDPALQ